MAIDRIGKSGGSVPPTSGNEIGGASRPSEATRPFEATRAQDPNAARPASAATGVTAAPALDQLRAGKIDLPRYLDMKVEEATKHLHGLRASELDHIKQTLRDQMTTDPALVDLVKQATGSAPEPTRDE